MGLNRLAGNTLEQGLNGSHTLVMHAGADAHQLPDTLNVLARLTSTAAPPSAETSLQLKVVSVANTARYDRLRTTDEETRNA